jgi:hypothetical protein
MYDLARFGLADMIDSGKRIRLLGQNATSMQDAAAEVVDLLYDGFKSAHSAGPGSALVRCFKTHPFAELPQPLQSVASASLAGQAPSPTMRCLTLLATRGELPQWNSPLSSVGHRVIPLPTAAIVEKAPMIARLIVQMGFEIERVVHPPPGLLIDLEKHTFNVFHVEDAVGSEYVPEQTTFIIPYGIRSVLGFGGLLPSGELFAVVMFTRVKVTRETAALFRTLALSVKLTLLPFSNAQIFPE